MLANQLAKRDQRAVLQAQRTQDFYTGMVGEIRSFDSVCDEAEQLLTESEIARMQIDGEKPKTKPVKAKGFKLFGWG
jgi:hypothetical protein